MNRAQAKQLLTIITAFADGKEIQRNIGGTWLKVSTPDFMGAPEEYRIKPEPKLRPWKPEEVPLGAWIKRKVKSRTGAHCAIITAYSDNSVFTSLGSDIFECYLTNYLHSTDNGKTWNPCGVEETQ